MKVVQRRIIWVILLGLALASCGEGDDRDRPDGDDPVVDGDAEEEQADGDVSVDGDEPSDGDDPPDGDEISDGDDVSDGDLWMDGDDVDGDESSDGDYPTDGDAPICVDVLSISGKVVDSNNNPLSNIAVVMCIYPYLASDACLNPVFTGGDGSYSVSIPEAKRCLMEAIVHIVPTVDRTYNSVYCSIDLGRGGEVSVDEPVELRKAPAPNADTLGNGAQPHDIVAADGTTLTVVPDDLPLWDATYSDLRLLVWNDAWGWPCFIDPDDTPDGLVALIPELEFYSSHDAVHIGFPNNAGLDAGVEVDLYAVGGIGSKLWDGTKVHEGAWIIIGRAVVSPDGSMIETPAGEGLPFWTWVGWKKR